MRPSPALPLLLVAALAGCDGDDTPAGVTVLYGAEVSTPTDVYVDQRRVLDDAAPGDGSLPRSSRADRTRLDLVPQLGETNTLGRRLYFALPKGRDYFVVVIGTRRYRVEAAPRDTLAAVVFRVPGGDSLRLVNTSVRTLDVTVGPPVMSPLGLPKTRLSGFGALSPPVAPGGGAATVTALLSGTSTVLYSAAVPEGSRVVVLGDAAAHVF